MSFHEKYLNYDRFGAERTIEESLKKECAYQTLDRRFCELKVSEVFADIKKDLWDTGEINLCQSLNDGRGYFNNIKIKLETDWPYFSPDHLPGYRYSDPKLAKISYKNIFIAYELDHQDEAKTISTTIKTSEGVKNTIILPIFMEPADDFKESVKNFIMAAAEKQKDALNFGSLSLKELIEKDRKLIIEKIRSRELLIENVPNNFFSEKEKERLEPSQREFLTKRVTLKTRFF